MVTNYKNCNLHSLYVTGYNPIPCGDAHKSMHDSDNDSKHLSMNCF